MAENDILVPRENASGAFEEHTIRASTTSPAALGTAAAGSSANYARQDHVHPMPSAADVGAAAFSHTHGNLTSDGKVGSTSGLPLVTTTAGAITTLALGSAGQVLKVNSGGTAVEFGAASGGVTAVGASAADILSVSGSDLVADDLGSDKIYGWDDSADKAIGFALNAGLSTDGEKINASAIFPKTRAAYCTTQQLQTQIINGTADAIRTWPSSGILFFTPIWVAEDTYNRIGTVGNTTATATAAFKIALYTANASTHLPDALVSGSEQNYTMPTGTTSNANHYVTVSLALKAGIYWIAMAQHSATWTNASILCQSRVGSISGASPLGVVEGYGLSNVSAYLLATSNSYWTAGTSSMPSDTSGITFQSPNYGFNRPVGFLAKV